VNRKLLLPRCDTDYMTLRVVIRTIDPALPRIGTDFMTLRVLLILSLFISSCSSNNDNAHTTATNFVPPPPRQVLRVVPHSEKTSTREVATGSLDPNLHADPTKPLLIFNLAKTFHKDEEVLIDFSLSNAKLKGDGGEYRVRYIVDDDEPLWIDKNEPIGLVGWIEGKHTIRLELIGPDGWPYRNGDYNVVTREILVSSEWSYYRRSITPLQPL
jgi:hypothetical protein